MIVGIDLGTTNSLIGAYTVLDLVPKGRDEDELNFGMEWVRHHDRYETNAFADADKPYWPKVEGPASGSCGCGAKGRL